MVKKVCLLVNYNLYESKRYFTEKLAEALERQGVKTKVVDVKEGNLGKGGVEAIHKYQPDVTLSYNSFLPLEKNLYLWDLLKIPHLSILVDPALYSVSLTGSPYSLLSCVDRSDVEAIKGYSFERVFFWPHATEANIPYDPRATRPYDVAFLGSCYDYENLKKGWEKRLPKEISKVLDHSIEMASSDNKKPLSDVLVDAWNHSKLSPEGIDFAVLFYYLDYYLRGYDRVQLIRSIKDAKVHVFGELSTDNNLEKNGWEHYLGKQKNVTLHPSIPFSESLQVLQKSKITLNSMPFFRDGTHERVFYGHACGALPLTSESLFLRESFMEGKDLLYYNSNNWDGINEQVNAVLRNEDKRLQAVASGRKKVIENHTWDHRAATLLEHLTRLISKTNS